MTHIHDIPDSQVPTVYSDTPSVLGIGVLAVFALLLFSVVFGA